MPASLSNHPRVPGITPEVSINNWGNRVTLNIKIGDFLFCSFLDPLEGELNIDYIERIIAALSEVKVDRAYEDSYA